jgi:hypothetical protein
LDREGADAAAGTVDQYSLTLSQPGDQAVTPTPTSVIVPAHSNPNGRGAHDGTG